MRLLDTTTLAFKEVYSPSSLRYAILSHRWSDEEVSFEDFVLAQQPADLVPPWQVAQARTIRQRTGFDKIIRFCAFAKSHGYDYCWLDTCCIDKRSSAELSEAINSMWEWYWDSGLCCVYLADVALPILGPSGLPGTFSHSAWFTRCWTLQELLAPRRVTFWTSSWEVIGQITKNAHASWSDTPNEIVVEVARVTGIPQEVLMDRYKPATKTVAQRMSWAAGRRSTRAEDVAYSLLGLFDVNMPLLYGERHKAFTRLQHEIIRQSYDMSIFAWRSHGGCSIYEAEHGSTRSACLHSCCQGSLLAPSPDHFRLSGSVVSAGQADTGRPYSITNRGLEVLASCDSIRDALFSDDTIFIMPLDCFELVEGNERQCKIALLGSEQYWGKVFRTISDAAKDVVVSERAHSCNLGDKLEAFYPLVDRSADQTRRFYLPVR